MNCLDNGDDILNELIKKTDQETVPNIFIKQQHIGLFKLLLSLIKIYMYMK